MRPVAQRLGLEMKVLDMKYTNALVEALDKVELVFHAAGPFVDTSDAMIRACLATNTHYLDVTGEIPVFENTFKYDEAAKKKGVLLLSGAGFDVVPTDCLAAYVASKLPSATKLDIAFAGVSGVSPGTLKSMVEGGLAGGLVRRGGELVGNPMGKGARTVRFVSKTRKVMPIPWGDLSTAYRTTGIRNITTYMVFAKPMVQASAAAWPITAVATPLLRGVLARPKVKEAIRQRLDAVKGPSETARKRGRCEVWARVRDKDGNSAEAWLETLEAYEFTAVCGVRCVEKTLALQPSGALTPALAFGRDFVLEIEGTRRLDELPADAAE
jgi:short subunit dehydrogenase-like uncharacterized protein